MSSVHHLSLAKARSAAALPGRRPGRFAGRLAGERGGAALEFALILPAILALIFGTIELCHAMSVQSTLNHAAAEGTRYAMVRGATSDSPASEAQVEAYVLDRLGSFDTERLTLDISWNPDNEPGSLIHIDVSYQHGFVAIGLNPITLTGSSAMPIAR